MDTTETPKTFDQRIFAIFSQTVSLWQLALIIALVMALFLTMQLCFYRHLVNRIKQNKGTVPVLIRHNAKIS